MTKQNEAVIKLPVRIFRSTAYWNLHDADGTFIVGITDEAQAHAIAHALNSQGKLIEALNRAVADELGDDWKSFARSAIQGAKGG